MAKVPDGLRGDLVEAVALEGSLFGSKRSLRAASEALRDNERVLAATTTVRKQGRANDSGVLIVTDQRLMFVRSGAFSAASEEIPLANISGVLDRKGLALAHIVVTGAGGITTTFASIGRTSVGPVMEAIRSHLTGPTVTGDAPPAASAADEIRKLAGLRDAGILTEEEFSAKKKQLLGL
ncbi:hypothetical protein GCM10009665_12640 [Kitasatospora nipponensis]|uniref:Oligomerization/nucleic acid binding protein n=1 Tax=Kitasatospora nipponensis TaxID=258049 RepID=A0ABN1VUD9_9ACTN